MLPDDDVRRKFLTPFRPQLQDRLDGLGARVLPGGEPSIKTSPCSGTVIFIFGVARGALAHLLFLTFEVAYPFDAGAEEPSRLSDIVPLLEKLEDRLAELGRGDMGLANDLAHGRRPLI